MTDEPTTAELLAENRELRRRLAAVEGAAASRRGADGPGVQAGEIERLRLAVAATREGVWDWLDVSGDEEWWSPRFYELLGYEDGEIEASLAAFGAMLHPDDAAATFEAVRRHLDVRTPFDVELRLRRKSGDYSWFRSRGHAVRGADGRATRMVGTIDDISVAKRAELELEASEERFRATFEQAAVGIAHVATDGRWLRVNQKLCDIVGYSREELTRATFQDITHPDDLEGDLDSVRRLLAGAIQSYSIEKRYVRKDGSLVWVLLTVALVRELGGGPEYFISVVEEIDARKAVEQRLAESERRLFDILDSLPVGVFVVEPDGRPYFANRSSRALLGKGIVPDATLDRLPEVYASYVAGTDAPYPPERMPIARALNGVRAYGDDQEIDRPEGRMPIEVWASPVYDGDGRLVFAVAAFNDIAERRKAEANVRSLQAALERRVADAEEANRELEAFSYSVSHDLRTPLRAIDGFSQVLIEDYAAALDVEGRASLDRVRAAAQRMGRLIDDLLKLSRIARGELRRSRVDLSSMAREVARGLRESEPEREVVFSIQGGLRAQADRRLLRILLENLVGNAWKFTRNCDAPRIELGSAVHQGAAAFFVRDNGAGFDQEYAGKLFAPFQRLHSPREFEGTGIGLATVARIVHRHGGRASAEGAVGRGATFYFTLADAPVAGVPEV